MTFLDYYLISVVLVFCGNIYDLRTWTQVSTIGLKKYKPGVSILLLNALVWPIFAIFELYSRVRQ